MCSDPDAASSREDYLAFHEHLSSLPWAGGIKTAKGFLSNSLFLRSNRLVSFLDNSGRLDRHLAPLVYQGTVDTIHSFAELNEGNPDRSDILDAYEGLRKEDVSPSVWTNHSNSPFNLVTGQGDIPDGRYYHAQELAAMGVRFIWTGALTPLLGQEIPFKSSNLWEDIFICKKDFVDSVREFLKHLIKMAIAFSGKRYRSLRGNRLLRPVTLRDGSSFWEFVRWGPAGGAMARFTHLKYILSGVVLDRLIRRGACSIVYTHLAFKKEGADYKRHEDVVQIFTPLAERSDCIWVCGTGDLLRYCVTRKYLDWTYCERTQSIEIRGLNDPVTGYRAAESDDLRGLSFICPSANVTFQGATDNEIIPVNSVDGMTYCLR